jgi:hypothetical protein
MLLPYLHCLDLVFDPFRQPILFTLHLRRPDVTVTLHQTVQSGCSTEARHADMLACLPACLLACLHARIALHVCKEIPKHPGQHRNFLVHFLFPSVTTHGGRG